jgi:uncharacterized protein (TIRG00374 family)
VTAGGTGYGFWVKAGLGLVITSALVAFLFRYIDLEHLGRLLGAADGALLLLGLGIWIAVYLVRTVRFVLVAPRTPYATMLAIASVHNFLLRLLPMRTGDLSYAFLVRRAGTAGLGESLLSLLLLRALDATTVVVVFTASLALDQGVYLGDRTVGIVVAAAAGIAGLVVVFTLGRILRRFLDLARACCRWVGLDRRPGIQRAMEKVEKSVDSFAEIKTGVVLMAAGASLVLWLLTFAAFFVIMRGFSMPVGATQTVLGSTAAVVTGFLPIGGIGSFGTLEAGWALGFVLVGLEQEKAVASGFGVSLTTFGYAALLGLLGWIGLWLIGRRKKTR